MKEVKEALGMGSHYGKRGKPQNIKKVNRQDTRGNKPYHFPGFSSKGHYKCHKENGNIHSITSFVNSNGIIFKSFNEDPKGWLTNRVPHVNGVPQHFNKLKGLYPYILGDWIGFRRFEHVVLFNIKGIRYTSDTKDQNELYEKEDSRFKFFEHDQKS